MTYAQGQRVLVVEHDESTGQPKPGGKRYPAAVAAVEGIYAQVVYDDPSPYRGRRDPFYAESGWRAWDGAMRWRLMADSYPVLTVRQPWGWAIEHGKPVENRGWNMKHRGPLWLHSGARSRWDRAGEESPLVRRAWADYARSRPDAHESIWRLRPDTPFMSFGAVTSLAEVTGCHHADECRRPKGNPPPGTTYRWCDPWAAPGQWHIEVRVIHTLPEPVPCRGMLGLWRLPEDVETAVRKQLEATNA